MKVKAVFTVEYDTDEKTILLRPGDGQNDIVLNKGMARAFARELAVFADSVDSTPDYLEHPQ